MIKLYLKNLLIALDQGVNAVFAGSPDECISTRAYDHYPKLRRIIDSIFGKGHCEHSAENEQDDAVMK